MAAKEYKVKVAGQVHLEWANSAEQASRRVEKALGVARGTAKTCVSNVTRKQSTKSYEDEYCDA